MPVKFPQIIDNRTLETRLDFVLNRILLPYAAELRIAVGYFYLSGYQLLLEGLNANREGTHQASVRVVMSPRTDRVTAAVLSLGHGSLPEELDVQHAILREFEIDVASASLEAAEELVEDLQSGRVQVRLCVDDFFHAKAYLARTVHGGIDHHYSIVGSSNFSVGGLTDNHELNLGTEEAGNYTQLVAWFDEIWDTKSVPFNQSLLRIMESAIASRKRSSNQQALQRPVSPFGMLLFLVRHYLGDLVAEQLKDSDQLAEFQRIGAENVIYKLERLGGAIVSDSVGLGKTYTAAEVIRRFRAKKKRVLVVTPPYVLSQWKQTLASDFGIPESSEVVFFSQGKLAQMKDSEIEKTLQKENFDLIVVDEAHRARNSETQLHRNLRALQRGGSENNMLLLTATPFNNSVSDLDNLVHLAVLRNRLTNSGFAPDSFKALRDQFRKLRTGTKLSDLEADAGYRNSRDQVRDILNAVMLLRMRSTIKERYKEVTIAGKPLLFEDPQVSRVGYEYTGKHHRIFANLILFLQNLKLPHIVMANPNSSGALNSLHRLLLFKRIESSLYAFYTSLQNIKARGEELKSEIATEEWGKVLEKYNQSMLEKEEDSALLLEARDKTGEDKEAQLLSKEDVLRWIDDDRKAIDEFISTYFHPLMKDKADPLSLDDPKMDAFLHTLLGIRKKVLVFTEYIATAEYLAHRLSAQIKAGTLQLKFAAVSALTKEETIASVLDRFAPTGRKAQYVNPSQELDLLISTDMLSEGVNLQDAGVLINFDLPWNPMRIVQRVGRVNRIGSENTVQVLNFVPDAVLEQFLNLLKILSSKITQVTALLGKEMAILSSDDEEIDARDIGEAIRKVHTSESVSDLELLARKNALFSALQGETEEDFFRMELFVASKKLRVRPSDFQTAPPDDGKTHYYTALSQTPRSAYRLYEIFGKRGDRKDLLLRVWIHAGADGTELRHPDEFLHTDLTERVFSVAELENQLEMQRMEEALSLKFEELLEDRREQNSPRNLDKRAHKIAGRQRDLATLLSGLSKQLNLGESFIENAKKLRATAQQVLDEVTSVLRFHELSAEQLRTLSRSMDAHSIDPAKIAATPAQHNDLAQVVFDFYDHIIMKDAALRVHLYARSEIHGRALATIYI